MQGTRKEKVSARVGGTLPPIMQIMKGLAAGKDVIDLSQGVPFFPPPGDAVKEALGDLRDIHRYGPDGGDMDLKELIAEKLSRCNSILAAPERGVMVTSGANLGFFNAVVTLCDPGNEVILLDQFFRPGLVDFSLKDEAW